MSYDDKSIDIGYRPKSSNVKARWDRATFPQDSLFDNFSRFFLSWDRRHAHSFQSLFYMEREMI